MQALWPNGSLPGHMYGEPLFESHWWQAFAGFFAEGSSVSAFWLVGRGCVVRVALLFPVRKGCASRLFPLLRLHWVGSQCLRRAKKVAKAPRHPRVLIDCLWVERKPAPSMRKESCQGAASTLQAAPQPHRATQTTLKEQGQSRCQILKKFFSLRSSQSV